MSLREQVIEALVRVANGTATVADAKLLAAIARIDWDEVTGGSNK